jgi:hypothetical protein
MTFVQFILGHINDDSKFGDVARDVAGDAAIQERWGYNSFKRHLHLMGACDAVLEIVEDLWAAYRNLSR